MLSKNSQIGKMQVNPTPKICVAVVHPQNENKKSQYPIDDMIMKCDCDGGDDGDDNDACC